MNSFGRKEVAAYLGLTVKALQKRRNKKQPPAYFKLGRVVRYRKGDVEASLVRVKPAGEAVTQQKVISEPVRPAEEDMLP